MELLIDRLDSPVGEIFIATTPRRLVLLEFLGDEARMRALLAARYPDLALTMLKAQDTRAYAA